MKLDFPEIKIILSEITPRTDGKDKEVIKCNELIKEMAKNDDSIFVAFHSNLRDEDYFMFTDVKHISRNAVPRFAANLKRALRSAYGEKSSFQRNRTNRHNLNHNHNYHNDATDKYNFRSSGSNLSGNVAWKTKLRNVISQLIDEDL